MSSKLLLLLILRVVSSERRNVNGVESAEVDYVPKIHTSTPSPSTTSYHIPPGYIQEILRSHVPPHTPQTSKTSQKTLPNFTHPQYLTSPHSYHTPNHTLYYQEHRHHYHNYHTLQSDYVSGLALPQEFQESYMTQTSPANYKGQRYKDQVFYGEEHYKGRYKGYKTRTGIITVQEFPERDGTTEDYSENNKNTERGEAVKNYLKHYGTEDKNTHSKTHTDTHSSDKHSSHHHNSRETAHTNTHPHTQHTHTNTHTNTHTQNTHTHKDDKTHVKNTHHFKNTHNGGKTLKIPGENNVASQNPWGYWLEGRKDDEGYFGGHGGVEGYLEGGGDLEGYLEGGGEDYEEEKRRESEENGENSGPRFDRTLPRKVTVQAGKKVVLTCRVLNNNEKAVSWMRHEDLHILSVGEYKYSSDNRIDVSKGINPGEWKLTIKGARPTDSGMYQCQVATKPVLSFVVRLNVVVPKAEVMNGGEVFVHRGSLINLTCLVTHGTRKPVYVYWYHGDQVLDYEGRGGVTVITQASRNTVSHLLMTNATPADSGLYSCTPSTGSHDTTTLHVLNGEHQAAMQSDSALQQPSPNTPLAVFTLIATALSTALSIRL